jgi:catechol 2,3-dioxygenase-like lactoylglutathione lyase family enzyme
MLRGSKAFSGFSVDDMAKAAQFYGQVLGLDVSQDEMGLTLKIQGSNPIFVYQKDDHAPATFTILNFPVDDIDKAVDELVSKRVVFERYDDMPTPQDSRGILRGLAAKMGPDIAWFKDPAGNILAVLQEA